MNNSAKFTLHKNPELILEMAIKSFMNYITAPETIYQHMDYDRFIYSTENVRFAEYMHERFNVKYFKNHIAGNVKGIHQIPIIGSVYNDELLPTHLLVPKPNGNGDSYYYFRKTLADFGIVGYYQQPRDFSEPYGNGNPEYGRSIPIDYFKG